MSLNAVINVGKRVSGLNYIYQSNLDPKNRFVDIEFSRSVWGNFDRNVGISTTAFTVELTQNGGSVTAVTLLAVKSIDSEIQADASSLTGGEIFARLFIDLDEYPDGIESIKVTLNKDNIYDIEGNKLVGQTDDILLSPLPYAIIGQDFMWWDVSEGGITEGIKEKSQYVNNAIADPTYETTIGTDANGTFANFNTSSLIFDNKYQFGTFDEEFTIFALQKYEGSLITTERGNIFDLVSDRTLLCYPYANGTSIGLAMVGSDNSNFPSGSGQITNNYEVIRINMQSDKPFEIFKDGISIASTSNFIPMTIIGSGRIGSNNSSPTTQNYIGKIYHLVIIKGRKTLDEISSLQSYFESL